ncbi:MAG: glucose-1-phosphate cytidylyltransferase [Termitinemataceae bacterium]|nr:MAG: glucose-1-phosphate cytidylyltransferase [Termitinemataceae bacterium]
MKVIILAGGLGTRLSEETGLQPKPMVEIGGKPILWHIMKIYSYYGFNEFVILTGYMSHVIKDYFINYYTRYSDITVDMSSNSIELLNHRSEKWKVTMLYTGPNTMTGGRLLGAKDFIGGERFMLTYGDGLSDIDINALLKCHEKAGKIVTLSAVRPDGKFGVLDIADNGTVCRFQEKPEGESIWVNGGFFVMESEVFDYLKDGEKTIFEKAPLENLARDGELNSFKHLGFWHHMDTLKDKNDLTDLWTQDKAPWALWQK